VLWGVARCGHDPEGQTAEVKLLAVADPPVIEGELASRRGEQLRTLGAELPASRHEVGVEVGFGCPAEAEPTGFGEFEVRRRIPSGIDDEALAVLEVDQVRAVPQPAIDDGNDLDGCRPCCARRSVREAEPRRTRVQKQLVEGAR